MTTRRLLAAAAAVGLVSLAAPAHANGTWSSPQRLQACMAPTKVAAAPDGSVWGVTGCGERMSLVHRTPAGSWSRRALPFTGFPRAVADDGRTTFFLFAKGWDATAVNPLWIAKVPHGGAPSAATQLQGDGSQEVANASLVARDGKWWAVWDAVAYGDSRETYDAAVFQARSFAPAMRAQEVRLGSRFDRFPHLALSGDGAVLVVARGQGPEGMDGTRPVLATSGPDGRFVVHDTDLGPTGTLVQDLAVSGKRTLVVTRGNGPLRLAIDDGQLRFTSRDVPTRAPTREAHVAASGGRAFVGHSECFVAGSGQYTCRAYVAETGLTGSFRTTELLASLGRLKPAVDVGLQDVTAARGMSTAVTLADGSLWAQHQR